MTAPAAWGYRPALDGVRAIAVALVVLYHAGLPSVAGGFVGVDVFFVLSGFLITNLLLVELDRDGTIRLRRFYARRIRRLLPAAVVMVVMTSLAAGLVETAASRALFVSDARHALVYVANWHFLAGTTDYFAADVEASPFLHFWSLAIEEQFYVVYPIVVLGVVRFGCRFGRPRALLPALAVVGAASLAAQWIVAGDDPLGAYFSTFTRLYQLVAGAMLAVVVREHQATVERIAQRAHLWGGVAVGSTLTVVLLATPRLDVSVSARGILATVAAIVTIAALDLAPQAPLARLLGRDPIAYLGRISYGIYLWHWPIVVFSRRALAITPIETAFIAGVGGTALAALSAQLIEAPIRRAPRLDARPLVTIATGLAVSAVVAFVVAPHVLGSNRRPALAQSAPTLVSSDPVVAAHLEATPPDVSPVGAGAIAGMRAYQAPDLVFPTERAYRAEAMRRPNVFSVDYDRIACPYTPVCIPAIDGQLVFFNQHHLDDHWLRSHADDLWERIVASGALAP